MVTPPRSLALPVSTPAFSGTCINPGLVFMDASTMRSGASHQCIIYSTTTVTNRRQARVGASAWSRAVWGSNARFRALAPKANLTGRSHSRYRMPESGLLWSVCSLGANACRCRCRSTRDLAQAKQALLSSASKSCISLKLIDISNRTEDGTLDCITSRVIARIRE